MDLHVNPEDRLAPGPKSSNKALIISAVFFCLVAAGFGWKFYKEDRDLQALRQRLAQEEAAAQAREQAEREAIAQQRRTRPEPTKHYYELNPPQTEKISKTVQQQPKQTVFNDQNYTPKRVANTMPAPRESGRSQTSSRPASARQSVQTYWAPWNWESVQSGRGGRKTRIGGQFSYQVVNGRIDTSTVCQNETRGSIRYRDCRKGAKKYFNDNCGLNRMFCSAGNMAP